jgi:hypothetical protein
MHAHRFLESVQRYYNDFSGRKLAEAASHVNEMLYKANMNMNKAVRQGTSLASMQVCVGGGGWMGGWVGVACIV